MSAPRPGFSAVVNKTANRFLRRGPKEVLSTAWSRVRGALFADAALIFLTKEIVEVEAGERGVLLLVESTRIHASDYARWIGTESRSTFRRRLTPATLCYLVYDGDRPVHATWVTTEAAWIGEIARYFVCPPRTAYVFESYTRAEARGRGIYPFALRGISEVLAERDIERLWVGVEAHNVPSLKAISKAGFTEAFRVRHGKRWGRRWLEADPESRALLVEKHSPEWG